MPKYFSPIYNVNAILKQKTITAFGKHYAFDDNADGYSIIDVQPEIAPTDIKAYLEGNLTLTSYPVSNNISKLCAYALASFPNLESVYLFKNDDLVELEQDAFFGLDNLDSVYVPDTLFDSYVATYPAYEDLFKKIISTMDLVVPTFTGVTKLTKEIFTQVVGMLESAKKNVIERVVVPAQYTELGTECFEAISQLSSCNTIVLEAVISAEADFMKGNSSISYIQIENADFSLQGVADTTGTANFKWLTPIAYMHDYIYQDYVKDYYITGYAGITNGQPMPSREEYGYWKWYSSPATTDDTYLGDSETYPTATYTGKAYAFLIIDTLVISGTGTLTSAIVENAINSIDIKISPLDLINKVKINSGFTNADSNCLDIIDNYDSLSNLLLLDTYYFNPNMYVNINSETLNKFNKIILRGELSGSVRYFSGVYIDTTITTDATNTYSYEYQNSHINTVIDNSANISLNTFLGLTVQRVYLPKAIIFNGNIGAVANYSRARLYLNNYIDDGKQLSPNTYKWSYLYCSAKHIKLYKENTTYIDIGGLSVLNKVGIIDGADVYTDKGFNYPKLSDTLTLDTSTGHLIENGTDLFTGYTATWYSDEDCTQVIQPASITADMTVYVKLS